MSDDAKMDLLAMAQRQGFPSLQKLAARAGLTIDIVREIHEKGSTAAPVKVVRRLASALRMPAGELMDRLQPAAPGSSAPESGGAT